MKQPASDRTNSTGHQYNGNAWVMYWFVMPHSIVFGITSAPATPTAIPQKNPFALNRHQYHFRQFAATYPPYNPPTIHCSISFTSFARNPKKTPTATTNTPMT